MCPLPVLPDGREHGIVFVSSSSAFSEAFLFELAVNLSRNGSSLRSSAYLREGFQELTAALKYTKVSSRLRSMTTLQKRSHPLPFIGHQGDAAGCFDELHMRVRGRFPGHHLL